MREPTRNEQGQFAPSCKKLRKIYLSDDDWELWGEICTNKGLSREEFIENYVKSKTRSYN
jgi:hypothetical protein